MHSCLYEGRVRHRRFNPVSNRFSYSLFMVYLDLDELPSLFDRYWLWSNEGRALARFRRADHLGPPAQPLDAAVRTLVAKQAGRRLSGPIRLLTHLEYFRYRFNPVSFFYCFDAADQRVETIVAEINNTPWREQHCYVLDRAARVGPADQLRFRFTKDFHISPFMGMNVDYDWRFSPPSRRLAIHMDNRDEKGRFFDATLTLNRRELSPSTLNGALLRYPFMTARVIAAIHYQALKLWLKRCPYFPHPKTLRPTAENAS